MEKTPGFDIDQNLLLKLPLKIASKFKVIPVKEDNNHIIVAVTDPNNIQMLDELALILGKKVKPLIAGEEEITASIKRYYGVGADTVARYTAPNSGI